MGKRRGEVKQHGMDVDKPKAAATKDDGWDYGGGGAAADDAMADGVGGQVAPPHTAPSVSLGDGGAKMGLFGLVTGGPAKKRKVQVTFKQKRRKQGKIAKAVARSERETTKRRSAGSRRETKTLLKKLW